MNVICDSSGHRWVDTGFNFSFVEAQCIRCGRYRLYTKERPETGFIFEGDRMIDDNLSCVEAQIKSIIT